jgi:hypothetical protein
MLNLRSVRLKRCLRQNQRFLVKHRSRTCHFRTYAGCGVSRAQPHNLTPLPGATGCILDGTVA